VPLDVVNNNSFWRSNSESGVVSPFEILGNRSTQCESEAMDSLGNLYCSIISMNSIVRFKLNDKYTPDDLKVVAYSPEQFNFITALKINKNSEYNEELWTLSVEPSVRRTHGKFLVLIMI